MSAALVQSYVVFALSSKFFLQRYVLDFFFDITKWENTINVTILLFLLSSEETNLSHVFLRHEFHYLNVARVGTITVDDIFDFTFECLQTPSCVSVNLAASKGADGKLWCEILSSGKYLNPAEFKENGTSHHFSQAKLGLQVSVH